LLSFGWTPTLAAFVLVSFDFASLDMPIPAPLDSEQKVTLAQYLD
jgi:hypothetical protein